MLNETKGHGDPLLEAALAAPHFREPDSAADRRPLTPSSTNIGRASNNNDGVELITAGHGDPLMKVALIGGRLASGEEKTTGSTASANGHPRPLHYDTEPKKHGDPLWQAAEAVDARLKDHKTDRAGHHRHHQARVAAENESATPDTTDELFSEFVQEIFGDELL